MRAVSPGLDVGRDVEVGARAPAVAAGMVDLEGDVALGDDGPGGADDLAAAHDLEQRGLADVVLEALDRDEVAVGEDDEVVGERRHRRGGDEGASREGREAAREDDQCRRPLATPVSQQATRARWKSSCPAGPAHGKASSLGQSAFVPLRRVRPAGVARQRKNRMTGVRERATALRRRRMPPIRGGVGGLVGRVPDGLGATECRRRPCRRRRPRRRRARRRCARAGSGAAAGSSARRRRPPSRRPRPPAQRVRGHRVDEHAAQGEVVDHVGRGPARRLAAALVGVEARDACGAATSASSRAFAAGATSTMRSTPSGANARIRSAASSSR